MKILLTICSLTLTGCSSTNISQLVTSLAKDPATVHVRATSIYGTVDFTRVGSTNGCTIGADGTVTVKP